MVIFVHMVKENVFFVTFIDPAVIKCYYLCDIFSQRA